MATYVSGVTLFDGRTVRTRAGVLVRGGDIEWVGAHARAPRAALAAAEVPGEGRTLTPGLFDSHVHLCFDGTADWPSEAAAMNEPMAALKSARNAMRQLRRGVTTVRDLGGMGTSACDVAWAVEAGVVPGPRIVASGRALTITGGHGHGLFAQEADGPDGVRKAVREQMRAGARSIKLVATGGVLTPGITVDFTAFTPEELAAAVDEAHSWGRPVAAHAHGAAGVENAVRAGVDSIEHGSQIRPDVARLMKERGTFHVPTIVALREIIVHPDEIPAYAVEKAVQMGADARDSFRRSVRAGVRVACGTDAGTPFNPHGNVPREVAYLVEWGLTPLAAMRAATSNAAELLRVADVTGTVEPGKAADLVLYEGNPLEDVSLLTEPRMVMKAGEVVVGEP